MVGHLSRSKAFFLGIIFLGLMYSPAPAQAVQGQISIKDLAGRTVVIPKKIMRVVPLGGALRFVVYLQALDKVVGVEALEKKRPLPAARPYSLAIEKITSALPAIGEGGPGKLPDFEKVLSVKPDIILTMGVDTGQVETIQQKTGIPVVALSYGVIGGGLDKESIYGSLRLAGRLLDRKGRSEEVITFFKKCQKDLWTRTSHSGKDSGPRAYVGAISFKGVHGITSTEAFYQPLEWVQARNVANEIGRPGHTFIDPEKLLLWNPEVLFLDSGGLDIVKSDYRRNANFYQRLSAVQKNRVFLTLPYNYYHTNIEIALADAYFMGKMLYPEYFKDIDPVRTADKIFTFFVGRPAYQQIKEELRGFGEVHFERECLRIK